MATEFKPVHSFILDLLNSAFPKKLKGVRQVGAEDEFVVVEFVVVREDDGTMGNATVIFREMAKDGWVAKHDPVTSALVGVYKDGVEIGTDVGVGTLEIGFPPVDNLSNHLPLRENVLKEVDARLAKHGLFRLNDYAVQPVTLPHLDHWAPKGRSKFFSTYFSREVDVQTASASNQVHIEITQDELIPVLEIMLALSGVFIGFNANSPIWSGKLDPKLMLAAREDFWDRFTTQKKCWSNVHVGLPNGGSVSREQPPSSLSQLAEWLYETRFLVHVDKGEIIKPDVTFGHWYKTQEGRPTEDELRDAYDSHEGTLWWDARPRRKFGTIEVRPSCQNAEAVSSDALVLGLTENWRKAHQYVIQTQSHEEWRRLRQASLKDGMKARGMKEIARSVLSLASDGLKMRGFREEELLNPLYGRVSDGISPGHVKLHIYNDGGMPALLRHLLSK
ncbi:hypothetical protein HY798_01425 [Candidatus Falkowbacteria bacterium]|nr:hypothetical protein [Candidatus Falkowbacteria bacterium]